MTKTRHLPVAGSPSCMWLLGLNRLRVQEYEHKERNQEEILVADLSIENILKGLL